MNDYNFDLVLRIAKEIEDRIHGEGINSYVPNVYDEDAPLFNYYFKGASNFLNICKNILDNTQINIVYADNQSTLYGVFMATDNNTVDIIINGTLNECWRRFSLLKELCSLYVFGLDKHQISRVNNYEQALEEAYDDRNIEQFDELKPDKFAELLAIELMIPYKFRQYTNALINRLSSSEAVTMNDIALSLKMPEHMLQYYHNSGLLQRSNIFFEL